MDRPILTLKKPPSAPDIALAWLQATYPDLFTTPKPLAIGIHRELFTQPIPVSRNAMRRALGRWCRAPEYLSVRTPGADRYGLDGRPVGRVGPHG